MAELKPCPFCGGEAEYKMAGGISADYGYVRCKKFCCEQHWYSLEKEAIEAWNRRAEDGKID